MARREAKAQLPNYEDPMRGAHVGTSIEGSDKVEYCSVPMVGAT